MLVCCSAPSRAVLISERRPFQLGPKILVVVRRASDFVIGVEHESDRIQVPTFAATSLAIMAQLVTQTLQDRLAEFPLKDRGAASGLAVAELVVATLEARAGTMPAHAPFVESS